MIVGAAVVPAAPLLVPGVAPHLPPGLEDCAAALRASLEGLPDHDLAVLLAAAGGGGAGARHGCHDTATATLAGIGRPDLVVDAEADVAAVAAVSRVTQYPVFHAEPLPLGLTALAMQVCAARPVPLVPVAVPVRASAATLVGVGAGIAEALRVSPRRAVLVAAGDLAAGLSPSAPLTLVHGARAWSDTAVDVVASGRLDGLTRLGPDEAARVGALGWAPLLALHGALAASKLGLALRMHTAPRGVAYLVASGR